MSKPVLFRAIPVFVALLAMTACGGPRPGPGTPEPSGNTVQIRVANDVTPPSLITVWIVTNSGERQRLGTVSPNGERTFNFTPSLRSAEYHLVADVEFSQERTSNPFNMEGVTTIRWEAMRPFIQRGR